MQNNLYFCGINIINHYHSLMKKLLLATMALTATLTLSAQTAPAISMKAPVTGASLTIGLATSQEVESMQVDWGDGNLVATPTIKADDGWQTVTKVTGTPVGTGEVKIYGNFITVLECGYTSGDARITELNVTNVPQLTHLDATSDSLTQLDLSKNTELVKLVLSNNYIKELDLKACTKLTSLTLSNNLLTSIDLSNNPSIVTLYLSNNQLASVDISALTALKSFYAIGCGMSELKLPAQTATNLLMSLNNNNFTTFDATGLQNLTTLHMNNNQLTELKFSDGFLAATGKSKKLNILNNKFTLATLPKTGAFTLATYYNYAPQQPMKVNDAYAKGDVLDLSAQNNIVGLGTAPAATAYTVATLTGTTLSEGTDYTLADGKITFLTSQTDSVKVTMTSAAYPQFAGTKVFATTPFVVSNSTSIQTAAQAALSVTAANGTLTVSGLAQGEVVTVYNAEGRTVATLKAKAGSVSTQLPSGFYVVKAAAKTAKVTL